MKSEAGVIFSVSMAKITRLSGRSDWIELDVVERERIVFSYEGVAYFGSDSSVSERPLPLAGCASLRAADGRACIGSLRERSAPFEVPPDAG